MIFNKKDKYILITGFTGSIGIGLIKKLNKSKNTKLILISRNIEKVKSLIKNNNNIYIKHDLLDDTKKIQKILEYIKLEAVVHMAFSKINDHKNFSEFMNINTKIIFNLLKIISKSKPKHIIYTNSSALYKQGKNIKENSSLGNSPYGLSKYYVGKILENYSLANKIYFKNLIIFSVFGEYEPRDRLISGAIYNSINKKQFIIKAPNQIRDYICTFDLVEAIYKSIKLKKSISLNICTGIHTETHKIVKKIFRKFSSTKLIKFNKKNYKGEILSELTGNNLLAKKVLGWKPIYDIERFLNYVKKI